MRCGREPRSTVDPRERTPSMAAVRRIARRPRAPRGRTRHGRRQPASIGCAPLLQVDRPHDRRLFDAAASYARARARHGGSLLYVRGRGATAPSRSSAARSMPGRGHRRPRDRARRIRSSSPMCATTRDWARASRRRTGYRAEVDDARSMLAKTRTAARRAERAATAATGGPYDDGRLRSGARLFARRGRWPRCSSGTVGVETQTTGWLSRLSP